MCLHLPPLPKLVAFPHRYSDVYSLLHVSGVHDSFPSPREVTEEELAEMGLMEQPHGRHSSRSLTGAPSATQTTTSEIDSSAVATLMMTLTQAQKEALTPPSDRWPPKVNPLPAPETECARLCAREPSDRRVASRGRVRDLSRP